MANQIRWQRGDYVRLGQAVAEFNKKVNELKTEENKLYLPEEINYKEQKGRIYSRKELNRVINSLKRFSNKNAEDILENEIGEKITRWEKNELNRQARIATRNLTKQLEELNIPEFNGFSRAQMGSEEARKIESTLKNINQLEEATGDKAKRIRRRIKELGTLDYEMYQSIIYKDNYMKGLEDYSSNYESYYLLKNKLNSIKNPINFFNYVKRSTVMTDFFTWYNGDEGSLIYGGFLNSEEVFEQGLEELGIIEEEKQKLLRKLKRKKAPQNVIDSCNSITSYQDLKTFMTKYNEFLN